MDIISLKDIIDCNAMLREKKLYFKIHLRDACGKQSCWIEALGICACEGKEGEFYQELEKFFLNLGHELEFSEDKLNFWCSQKRGEK